MTRTPFSTVRYSPPVPVLPVQFNLIDGSASTEVLEAIVDTGADMTLVPARIMRQLEAIGVLETQLVSQWGDSHPVTLYLIDLNIDDLRLPGVYVAADDTATEIILGRNVLNKLPLFLDGPHLQTEALDDATASRLRARHP